MLKKILWGVALCSLFITLLSMSLPKKSNSKIVIPKNEPTIIKGKNGISVLATDVESNFSNFKRAIKITSTENKSISLKFVLSYTSDNINENIYETLKYNPNTFNGNFTIETEGQEIYNVRIENGKAQRVVRKILSAVAPPPVYDANVACGVGTVHDCVSYKIEEMNWIEYGICLASAPGCYAGIWASCTWEVCHNHMRYTDPNGI